MYPPRPSVVGAIQDLVSRRMLFGGQETRWLPAQQRRAVCILRTATRSNAGERFSQLSDDEKSEMIERARQLGRRRCQSF